jgi:hypothetical protein
MRGESGMIFEYNDKPPYYFDIYEIRTPDDDIFMRLYNILMQMRDVKRFKVLRDVDNAPLIIFNYGDKVFAIGYDAVSGTYLSARRNPEILPELRDKILEAEEKLKADA